MNSLSLSIREKVLQTVVLRHKQGVFCEEKVGGLFFGGEIITEAEDVGLDAVRETLARYVDHADIPPLITSDFENGCGSMIKGLTPFPYLSSLGATNDPELAYRYGKATHGHLPHKGPTPTLVAFGPDMKEGAVLANAELVDEAPTFAHCLGIEMKNTDGRVLTELFK